MLKKLILLALFGVSFGATAQTNFRPGYVLTPASDTLRGEVAYRGEQRNAVSCQFRPSNEANATTYSPTQARGYGFTGGRQYQSQTLPDSTHSSRFVRVLVSGKLSLYHFIDKEGKEMFFAGKDLSQPLKLLEQRDTLITGKDNQNYNQVQQRVRTFPFRNVLWDLMADCPSVQSTLARAELAETKLIGVVASYNDCVGKPQYVSVPKKSNIVFSLLAGVQQTEFSYRDKMQEINSPLNPYFGASIQLQPARFNYHLSIIMQALYTHQKYHTDYKSSNAAKYGFELTNVKISAFHIPLLLRYSFTKGVVRPYIQAGGIAALNLKGEAEEITSSSVNSTYQIVNPIEMRKYGFGYVMGLGIMVPIQQANSVSLEARLNSFDSTSEIVGVISGSRVVSVLAGYTFGR